MIKILRLNRIDYMNLNKIIQVERGKFLCYSYNKIQSKTFHFRENGGLHYQTYSLAEEKKYQTKCIFFFKKPKFTEELKR